MQLSERPGLFVGTKFNRPDWYVIDPAASADPAALARAWQDRWAPTNTPRARRVVAAFLGWMTVVVFIAVGSFFGAALLQIFPSAFFGAIVLGIAGLVGGGILGVLLHSRIAPRGAPNGPKVPGIVGLSEPVQKWPTTNALPISDLWALNNAVIRTRDVQLVFNEWGPWYDREFDEYPAWALENVVEPILRRKLTELQTELVSISGRLGFPLPEELVTPPVGFSEFEDV